MSSISSIRISNSSNKESDRTAATDSLEVIDLNIRVLISAIDQVTFDLVSLGSHGQRIFSGTEHLSSTSLASAKIRAEKGCSAINSGLRECNNNFACSRNGSSNLDFETKVIFGVGICPERMNSH